jgi:2-dehydro-3-deoxyphosphogluconate aldolase/(4S)-4-hydroxy-2-oxoglutarate aldolase
MNLAEFKKQPLMGIVRGIELKQAELLAETVLLSGLKTIEITMNTVSAASIIRRVKKIARNRLTLGAGTVLSMDSLRLALDAGATFIVTPILVKDVIKYCLKNKIPVFPGALSPQEIYNAWAAGATMVKVFPVKFFGPEYLREIKGPFNDIELLACAGLTPENLGEYFACGANAAAFGGNVFRKEWLCKKDYRRIIALIKAYLRNLPAVADYAGKEG